MNEASPLNAAAIERLLRLGGEKFVVEMIDLYFSYGAQKMKAAHQAFQAGDARALAEAVHPLRSSAGNVGASAVQELAAQVERAAQEQKTELAGAQLNELERAFAASCSLLTAERARLARPPA